MLLKFQSRRLTDPPGVEVGWGCAEEAVSLLRIRVLRDLRNTRAWMGSSPGQSDGWENVLLRGARELESMWLIG